VRRFMFHVVTSGAAAGAEVLYDGCMSKSGCVYSFGVVLWELLAGSRAWAGLNHAQVRLRAAARLRPRPGVKRAAMRMEPLLGGSARIEYLVTGKRKPAQPIPRGLCLS